MRAIRVLIVEEEGLYRSMLRIVLSSETSIAVVGTASDGQQAIRQALELGPDVVVVDIDLGKRPNGIEAGHEIRAGKPGTGIVLLSMHMDKEFIASLSEHHASGWSYLLKQNLNDTAALVRAIHGLAVGLVVLDPAIVQGLRPREGGALQRLTPLELEVLCLMAEGYGNTTIADKLAITVQTVENHVSASCQQLEVLKEGPVDSRVVAVLRYLQETQIL